MSKTTSKQCPSYYLAHFMPLTALLKAFIVSLALGIPNLLSLILLQTSMSNTFPSKETKRFITWESKLLRLPSRRLFSTVDIYSILWITLLPFGCKPENASILGALRFGIFLITSVSSPIVTAMSYIELSVSTVDPQTQITAASVMTSSLGKYF